MINMFMFNIYSFMLFEKFYLKKKCRFSNNWDFLWQVVSRVLYSYCMMCDE